MGTSIYSFGEDSPLKLKLSDRLARDYNEAVEQFFKAQQRLNQRVGKPWNPATQPINLKWSKRHGKAWNEVARIFNDKVAKRGGSIDAGEIMDDFLIKNIGPAASAAFSGSRNWGRAILLATCAGALYGLLNRRNTDRS